MKFSHHDKFTVGTLTYDKKGLWVVFFWLMWNDFTITLLERVVELNGIQMKDRGATYTLMAGFSTAAGLLGIWINPFFSTWSDRTRTRFGRRRPFLLISTPLFAASLCAIPFMPDFYHFVMKFHSLALVLNKIPINGEILFIGVATVINALFNGVVLAIFSYYYWDVVPEMVLGRFNSMVKIFTAMACLVWSFWVVGYAENHMKLVYIGVSVFCLSAYLLSVWRVKEGEYPPPAPRKNTNLLEPLYEYFSDCFSKPYYLWIFFGSLCFQLGNQGNNFAFFYFRYDLGMDLGTTGWISGMSQTATIIFGLLFGYSAGSMVDRLLPLRVIPVTYFIWTLLVFISFFVVHDKQSAVVMACCVNLLLFVFGVALSAATVKMFPREKIGQFCSAQACFTATGVMILNPLVISPFFDWIKYNRAAYLWSSVFYFLAGLISVKVYFNWKATQEPSPELEA